MNINSMQYFVTTIDCGSLPAAANELFMTLQGLNQALQRLESEYGVKLYYREENKVLPTEAGTMLYHTFSQIISLNSSAIDTLRSSHFDELAMKKNSVTIFSAPIFTEMILPKLLPAFCKRNPYARLKIIEFPSHDAAGIPVDPLNSICLFSASPANMESISGKFPELPKRHILCRTPVLMCMSKKSPLAGKERIARDDMTNMDIVLCRNDGYFLRSLYPVYDKSKIVIRSQSKTLGYSVLCENKNTVGFTSAVEFYYFKDKPLVCSTIEPRLETVYGYLTGNVEKSNTPLARIIEMIELEFSKIAKSMAL